MKIAGVTVEMFRCAYDPMIGPKPRQAFVPSDLGWRAYVNDNETGVVIITDKGQRHFVPFTNIQSSRLAPETVEDELQPIETKRKPGRQPAQRSEAI